jgi:hypothetical protein
MVRRASGWLQEANQTGQEEKEIVVFAASAAF